MLSLHIILLISTFWLTWNGFWLCLMNVILWVVSLHILVLYRILLKRFSFLLHLSLNGIMIFMLTIAISVLIFHVLVPLFTHRIKMGCSVGDEGIAILQLRKWCPSQFPFDLSEFREAFISPTKELLLLLSYHCEALLFPLIPGNILSLLCLFQTVNTWTYVCLLPVILLHIFFT